MDPLTTAAASGVQARIDSLDMLANNLSNGSSTGFKVDREFYSTYFAEANDGGFNPAVGDSPVVEKRWTDFTQGNLVPTGNPTDLALTGKAFFAVNGPSGTIYTRNGNFQISSTGTLVTADGLAVRQTNGQPIQVQGSGPLTVSAQGEISQNGQPLGQLEIDTFADPHQLIRTASSYFQSPDPLTVKPTPATDSEVTQGKLESSNSLPAESATRMVSLLRHFEMLQHAIKVGTDMNKAASEEVARVTT